MAKGGKREGAGNKPGNKHKKTLEWEALGDMLLGSGATNALNIMNDMAKSDPEKFLRQYSLLLEYFKPKLARSENENKNTGEVTIKVDYGRKPD